MLRCAGREELVAVASVFRYKALQGKRLANKAELLVVDARMLLHR